MRRFQGWIEFLLTCILLSGAVQNSGAQQAPFRYADFMQQLRQAEHKQERQKEAGEREDASPVIALIQSEGYPKAISEAAKRGREEDLRTLYEAKFGTQWPRAVEGTPILSFAAMNGDTAVVKQFIARGADVNARNAEGWTALHHAAEYGSVEIVKLLLDKGADSNAATKRFAETPLMLACGLYGGGRTTERGNGLPCARLLLDRGAKINAATKDGQTALRYAAYFGRVDTVKLLLGRGADVARQDAKGQDALADVIAFDDIGADGKITITQDSVSVPTYKLTVSEALIGRGKMLPGRYVSEEAERKSEVDSLHDFQTIITLLRDALAARP